MHWDNLSYLLYHSGNNCLLFTYVKSECCAGPWNLGLRAFEIRRKHIKINHFLCAWGNFIRTGHIKQRPRNSVDTSFRGLSVVIHRRFELRTPWLKVKCSANWANGSFRIFCKVVRHLNIISDFLKKVNTFSWKSFMHRQSLHENFPPVLHSSTVQIAFRRYREKRLSNKKHADCCLHAFECPKIYSTYSAPRRTASIFFATRCCFFGGTIFRSVFSIVSIVQKSVSAMSLPMRMILARPFRPCSSAIAVAGT